MRISDLFGQRLWTTGLILAIAIGSYGVADGQVQSGEGIVPQTNSTISKIKPWLTDARQAIKNGNQEAAKHYLQVAEAISKQPGEQLPADLSLEELKRQIEQMSATTTPSNGSMDFAPKQATTATNSEMEVAAQNALLKARQALAQGQVPTAKTMVESAKKYQVDFSRMADSPENVEAMIATQNRLVEMSRGNDAKAFNQQTAMFFVEQAKVLMQYKDWQAAESLLLQAKAFPVDFAAKGVDVDGMITQVKVSASQTPVATAPMTTPIVSTNENRAVVMKLMSQAEFAISQSRWADAKEFITQAEAFNLPDSEFDASQKRPWQLALVVNENLERAAKVASAQVQSNRTAQATNDDNRHVIQADYVPESDRSRIAPVSGQDDKDRLSRNYREFNPIPSRGMQLYRSGLELLDEDDTSGAVERFEAALQYREQLDQATRTAIRTYLAKYQDSGFAQVPDAAPGMDDESQELFRRLQSEVFNERSSAERLLETSPRKALDKMTFVRQRITESQLDATRKKPLLTIIDRDINVMQQYIEDNLSEILNEENNAANLESIELRRQRRLDVEQQIQALSKDFNNLMDQRRWAEAEAIARQAYDLAPQNEIAMLMAEKAKLQTRNGILQDLADHRENRQQMAFGRDMEQVGTPADFHVPMEFGSPDDWIRKSQERLERLEMSRYSSPEDRRIWNTLKNTNVQGDYTGTLSEAIAALSNQAGINIIFDTVALSAEGITTNVAVDVPIQNPISLQSALNVVLGTQGLVFIVEDEVIKVTSKEAQRKDVDVVTYYVGDLVTPMASTHNPMQMNFITPYQGLNTKNSVLSQNQQMPFTSPAQMQANNGAGAMNQVAMAQQLPNSPFGGGLGGYNGYGDGPQRGTPTFATMGGPQLGGVTEADFDQLIDLIKSTIAPDDWDDTNGDGSIQAFVPNLSLIVSNTQQVQDQIQDLLERLRELNDVQIVVEVRFVVLTDNFFERVGIDFDFRLNDNSGLNPAALPDEVTSSVAIGREPVPENFTPTGDLDIAFGQNSFASAIPTFGGFDAATAANFGFAILSDIEVFFLIQASKGDSRSNVTQAPTVTMFNGQSANVSDGATRPFVTSVVPVVGDFAVAHQPVITLIPEGTSLNVQATVSHDRRFVRLALVPFFSEITSVETFTFDGSTTTRRASDSLLQDLLAQVAGNNTANLEELETITEGTTIQLPVISFTTINTVVSVPDGGTVLMGGVKRMSEGRTERGVPFLSNVPYVNRLFKNVGIGRSTSNLMMMVTPRIIIQEEEERFQVGPIGGN